MGLANGIMKSKAKEYPAFPWLHNPVAPSEVSLQQDSVLAAHPELTPSARLSLEILERCGRCQTTAINGEYKPRQTFMSDSDGSLT